MPTFPFQFKEIDFGKLFNPLVLLPVRTPNGWQSLWFLVDSGADTTVFPLRLAEKLGIRHLTGAKTSLFGIGKQALDAFPGKLTFQINGTEVNVRCYFTNSQVSSLLLGRLDVFERYSVTFDSSKKMIVFDEN